MNTLTRWDPLRELDDLQNRLSSLFGRAPIRKEGEKQEALRVAEWAPLVDITEDEKEYLIKAEVPEVKKDEVKVAVQNDVLTISGERKYEKEEKYKKISPPRARLWKFCQELYRSGRCRSRTCFCGF